MKKLYTLCAAFMLCTAIQAVPMKRTTRIVRLTDGTEIMASIRGDENGIVFTAPDGRLLSPKNDGLYDYATPAEVQTMRKTAALRKVGTLESAPLKSKGQVNVPVVLVQFADRCFTQTDPERLVDEYTAFFNGENYTENGNVSSVRSYLLNESDGLFQPQFDILGPVTLDKGYAYYGKNSGSSIDVNYRNFCTEALQKLNEKNASFSWDKYDNGGNGKVDMVYFIFAGTGENTSYIEDELWPKESTASTTIGGTVFESSALCSEAQAMKRHIDENGQIIVDEQKPDGIGVILHELMHALGLPDFYDTQGTTSKAPAYGMDLFSIMDYGEYNFNGYEPSGLTAYERDFLGWRPLIEISEKGTYTLNPVNGKGAVGYKIASDYNPNEYYILECRDSVGNDKRLAKYAQGMTITHVDYLRSAWTGNRINTDPAHQRITLLPADGKGIGIGWVNGEDITKNTWRDDLGYVPFPGKGEVSSLTNDSPVYPPTLFTPQGAMMSKPIYNISRDKETMAITFDFLENMHDIEDGIASASRSMETGAYYTLDGRQLPGNPKQPGIYIRNNKKTLIK